MPEGKQYLPNSEGCFVCGEDNHAGLKTRFYIEGDTVCTDIEPADHHCGYDGIVHGGIVGAVIDETMGWSAARALGLMCFTAELNVRYLKHVPSSKPSRVVTWVTKSNKRIAMTEGEVRSPEGEVYARATAKFMPLSVEDTVKVDDMLLYRGGEARLFDHLREDA